MALSGKFYLIALVNNLIVLANFAGIAGIVRGPCTLCSLRLKPFKDRIKLHRASTSTWD